MVDLDSNPTKLIEVVEIGKQLLITRGALTTFSIANDVAKYFAIIPAMFAGAFPVLDRLNVMALGTPESAILSRGRLQRAVIVALIPLALRGVKFPGRVGRDDAAAQPAHLRRRRDHRAVRRHQADRPRRDRIGDRVIAASSSPDRPGDRRLPRVHGARWACSIPSRSRASPRSRSRPTQMVRSLKQDGKVVGSSLIGQNFTGPQYFHPRPSSAGDGYDAMSSSASNLGPSNPELLQEVRERIRLYRAENGLSRRSRTCRPTRSPGPAPGLDPMISPENARLQAQRVADARGMTLDQVMALVRRKHHGRSLGFLGEPGVNVLELNLALDGQA